MTTHTEERERARLVKHVWGQAALTVWALTGVLVFGVPLVHWLLSGGGSPLPSWLGGAVMWGVVLVVVLTFEAKRAGQERSKQ